MSINGSNATVYTDNSPDSVRPRVAYNTSEIVHNHNGSHELSDDDLNVAAEYADRGITFSLYFEGHYRLFDQYGWVYDKYGGWY